MYFISQAARCNYGLNDGKTMTYEQIGNRCEISRERVRQIKNKAIKLL